MFRWKQVIILFSKCSDQRYSFLTFYFLRSVQKCICDLQSVIFLRIYLIGRTHMETLHWKCARQRRTEQAYDWVKINSAKECDCCWCVSVYMCVYYMCWERIQYDTLLARGYHSKSPINFTIIRIRGTVQNHFCTSPESNHFFSFLEFVAWIRKKIVLNLLWVYKFKIQSKWVYNFWTIHNQKVDLFDEKEILLVLFDRKEIFFKHTVYLASRSKIDVFDKFYFKFRTMWIFFRCVSIWFCVRTKKKLSFHPIWSNCYSLSE